MTETYGARVLYGPIIFGDFVNLKMEAVRGQIFMETREGFRGPFRLSKDKTVLKITKND